MINVAMVTPAAATSAAPAASPAVDNRCARNIRGACRDGIGGNGERIRDGIASAYASQPQQPLFQTLYQPDSAGRSRRSCANCGARATRRRSKQRLPSRLSRHVRAGGGPH